MNIEEGGCDLFIEFVESSRKCFANPVSLGYPHALDEDITNEDIAY